ncbi:unnamed protein product [Rhizophagus irregularis]|nr:unnamed protein product [Rhizophagus irregularis]
MMKLHKMTEYKAANDEIEDDEYGIDTDDNNDFDLNHSQNLKQKRSHVTHEVSILKASDAKTLSQNVRSLH